MLFEFEDKNLNPIYEKVCAQERLSLEDGVTFWKTLDLLGVGYMANIVRERMNGDKTYFIHNRHINPTNICIHSCQFCSFGVKEDHPHAYEKSLDDIFSDAEKYNGGDVSEFHNEPQKSYCTLHSLGPDRCVFYDFDSMKGAVQEYISSPQSNPKLGDVTPVLDYLDPFRDGKGGERIGEYISWYLRDLDNGVSRDDALNLATQKYAEKWGSGKVIRGL